MNSKNIYNTLIDEFILNFKNIYTAMSMDLVFFKDMIYMVKK